jgi:hypothetical protein
MKSRELRQWRTVDSKRLRAVRAITLLPSGGPDAEILIEEETRPQFLTGAVLPIAIIATVLFVASR